MTEDQILSELEAILAKKSIQIKYSRGFFKGGLCRYRDEKNIYLNRNDSKEKHISIIISELEKMDLDDLEIPESIAALLSNIEA